LALSLLFGGALTRFAEMLSCGVHPDAMRVFSFVD
jgi:hypothetical protein